MAIKQILVDIKKKELELAEKFKERIAEYQNPVEFVNNMYGCHPGGPGNKGYFETIFK